MNAGECISLWLRKIGGHIGTIASAKELEPSRRQKVNRGTKALTAKGNFCREVGIFWLCGAEKKVIKAIRYCRSKLAGDGVDLVIRAAAQELNATWAVPLIVENRPGAGGTIGTDTVFRAPADGYTLLATVNQTITTAPFLFKSLAYDPSKLVPVSLMVQSDNFMLANPDVPANNFRELVDLVKREPRKWTFGSFGRGSQPQLLFEYLNKKEDHAIGHHWLAKSLVLIGDDVGCVKKQRLR